MKTSRWNSAFVIALIAAAAVLVANWATIYLYFYVPFVQGWDGQGMASAGQYYAEHIFPGFWGWISAWCAGMPFPQFYPPLFFFAMAVVSKLAYGVSYTLVFKIAVTLMQLAVPGILVFFVSRRTRNPWALWMTAVTAVLLVSSYFSDINNVGVNAVSTFHTGMVTQLFGFLLLILWLHFFLRIESDAKARYWAGLFLFLTFLANGHDDIAALLMFISVYVVSVVALLGRLKGRSRQEKAKALGKQFRLYFVSGLLPLLATAMWSLPLLATYTYVATTPVLDLPTVWQSLMNEGVVWFVPVIGLLLAIKHKKRELAALSLSVFVILFFMYMPAGIVFTGLPTATARWFAIACFLIPIIIGLVYEDVAVLFRVAGRKGRSAFFVAVAIIFAFSMGLYSYSTVGGYYLDYQSDHFDEITSYVAEHKDSLGITMDEAVQSSYSPTLFLFDSVLGPIGGGAPVFDMRESSINSIFMSPVRNSLSFSQEGWGFTSYIGMDTTFYDQDISKSLDRAALMGIQSFLVRSAEMKQRLASDPRVAMVKSFGHWELWSFTMTVLRAADAVRQPILFYGNLTFKDRGIAEHDWTRIQEEALFADASDTAFIYPANQNLDTSTDFGMSSTTMVASYKYNDLNVAYSRLAAYSQKNTLILVASTDPLFGKLGHLYEMSSTTGAFHIKFLDDLKPSILDSNPLRAQLGKAFSDIREENPLVDAQIYPVSATVGDAMIHVQMSGSSTVPVPVIIKASYFPAWKRTDGAPVYLTTPGFMLTYATGSFDLYFSTPWYVYAGWIISIIVAIIAGGLLILRSRR